MLSKNENNNFLLLDLDMIWINFELNNILSTSRIYLRKRKARVFERLELKNYENKDFYLELTANTSKFVFDLKTW